MYRKTFLAFITILFLLSLTTIHPEEIRGIWVVRWDIDEPLKVFKLMDRLKKYDINTLFVQVYARGEAMYKSKLAPRATELLNAPFSYDPLALVVELGHRKGYKVHAWVNLFYVWSQAPFPLTTSHISHKHPQWFIGDSKGTNLKTFSIEEIKAMNLEGYFLEPGNLEVRDYLKKIVTEIVKNYDVDGIHMDYCRYPGRDYGYDIPARVLFMRENYVDPLTLNDKDRIRKEFGNEAFFDLEKKWDNWRSKQVTSTIKELDKTIKNLKPNAQVSVAVVGDYNYASGDLFQNWVLWADSNYVDFVVPMLYSASIEWVERRSKSIAKLIGSNKLAVGLGAYLQDYGNLLQEIIRVEGIGARGYLIFSYGGMEKRGYFK